MPISKTPNCSIKKSPNRLNQKPKNLTSRFSFTTTISSTSNSSSFSESSSSESMMEETIKNAESIIDKWEIDSHSSTRFVSIFNESRGEATAFINCVTGLHRAMRFLVSRDFKSDRLSLAQKLMQIAMKRLQREFHLVLSDIREDLEPGSVSSLSSQSSIDSEEEDQQLQITVCDVKQPSSTTIAISNLRLIADTMITCGYGKECIVLYKIIRKSTIDEALFHLGIHPYNSSHINKMINSPHFDDHVKNWLNAVRIAVKTLFREEKFLCDHIFTSSVRIRDSCFENSTKEGAMNLFAFPELIARCKKPRLETIFVMMDLYNSISDIWPEIESIFSNESISSVKIQALSSLHKLADSIRTSLSELESSIHKNSSKLTVSGGGIHPLTNSVMTYLSSLSDYGLRDIIAYDLPFSEQTSDEISPDPVSVKLASIILALVCKLDGKAKFHNNVALSYLFLVNNLHFIIEKVRTTNLKFILGEEWITNHEKKLKQYVLSYESMTWNKVISCLPENSLVSPEKVRDCFRKLYSMFEEVYSKQTSWIVVDEKMRDDMKVSIANKLVPLYKEFYGKNLITLGEDERCMKMLMRLSPENMAKYLSELFPGTSAVVRSSRFYSLTLPVLSLSQVFRSLYIQNTTKILLL